MSCVSLEKEFTEEEVFEELMHYRKDKSLGLDGFNMGFMQKFWHVMEENILELFKELHDRGFL